jgi:hypothetical protein
MKKVLFFLGLICWVDTAFGQNIFPATGNVGIGTTSPATMLEVKSGINVDGTSMGFIAPYIIGLAHDVGAGQTIQYILLSPMLSTGIGNPSAGLDGILSMYRGNTSTYNINAVYRVVIQDAYSTNHISVIPLSENSPMINVYQVTYNGKQYAALKITEVSYSSYKVSFRGQWWNSIDGTKPQLVESSSLTSVITYKKVASAFGSFMFGTTNGNILIGKSSQTNTSYKLDVAGKIRANQVTVNTTGADYVFDSAYRLPSVDSLQHFIHLYHHLPGMLSADEVEKDGVSVGAAYSHLLENMEKLTLYVIKLQNEVEKLKKDKQ